MVLSALSLLLLAVAWLQLFSRIRAQKALPPPYFKAVLAVGLSLHVMAILQLMQAPSGYEFNFFKVAPLFFAAANTVIFISSLRHPMHTLFLFSLPLSVFSTLLGVALPVQTPNIVLLTPGLLSHVLLSLVAYSLMTAALFQALVLNYQHQKIRSRHPGGFIRLLPPLQTMEALLFELLWAGQITLTVAIASGAIFIENLLAQHLAQKTVFALLAWLTYATLLWGRHARGWRGPVAMRWTLIGFVFLMLAYFGTKIVLELILHRV